MMIGGELRAMSPAVPADTLKAQWPTPLADDSSNCGGASRVRSYRAGKYRGLNAAVVVDGGEPHGRLNPMWVEWLMGYPGGWTDL